MLFPVACTGGSLVATTNTATATPAPRPMVGTETATMTVMVNETDTAANGTFYFHKGFTCS